jgi:hypothetical protein
MASATTKSSAPIAPPTPRAVLEIDPDGDMVVSVGEEETSAKLMKVSSKILTLVSPVFKIMLSKDWLEGQKVHSEESPLRLPDDDPTATELMFKLYHYQIVKPADIPEKQLLPLVCTLEKYSALTPFRPHVLDKAGDWQCKDVVPEKTPQCRRSLLRGIVMALMFNDPVVFRSLTSKFFNLASRYPVGESQVGVQQREMDLGTHPVVRGIVGR